MVDARKFASKYIKPDTVRTAPLRTRIVSVFEDERYGRLALELENGAQFGLNDTNNDALIKAFGHETEGWIGKEAEFSLGHYPDWKSNPPGQEKETVKVRGISADANGSAPKPLPPSRIPPKDDYDDSVPFS